MAGRLIRPTPTRQDAPFRGQGRSSAAGPRVIFHTSRFTAAWSVAGTKAAHVFSNLYVYNHASRAKKRGASRPCQAVVC